MDSNHIDIVKPANTDAYSYLAFKAAYQTEMRSATPNQALVAQFDRVINTLNSLKITQQEVLFPQLDAYLRDPSEARWRDVKSTAATLIDETKDLISKSRSFDSQFYEQGGVVIALADGAMQVVSRSYLQPFSTARQIRGPNLGTYNEITREDRPTREQAMVWATQLKNQYNRMEVELARLVEIVRFRL